MVRPPNGICLFVYLSIVIEGQGQTEVEFMDLEDQALLREEILTLLGLTHAPDKAVHRTDLRDIGNHTVNNYITLLDKHSELISTS